MTIETVIATEQATLTRLRDAYRNGAIPVTKLVDQADLVQYLTRLRDAGGPLTNWKQILELLEVTP